MLKRHVPLAYSLDNKTLLLYRFGKLYLYNYQDNKKVFCGKFRFSFLRNIVSRCSLMSRLLRLDPRYGIALSKTEFLIVAMGKFHILDVQSKTVVAGVNVPVGGHPLNIVRIEDIYGFDDGLFFGDYGSSFANQSCSIYRIARDAQTYTKYYTFGIGTIGHIHNIIPDKINQCVWILTGDFGEHAGIWKATNNFMTVTPVLLGDQKYRACIAFPTKDGLIYATDSPFEQNYLQLLKLNKNNKATITTIIELPGSVIYGYKDNEYIIFSTAVEPNGTEGIKGLLSMKRGDAIKDDYSHLYLGNIKDGFRIIDSKKKDKLPYALFQFGVQKFPTGFGEGRVITTYSISLKPNSLATTFIKY